MKHTLWTSVSFGVAMAFSAVAANAFTLTGKVNDESGKAVQNEKYSHDNDDQKQWYGVRVRLHYCLLLKSAF